MKFACACWFAQVMMPLALILHSCSVDSGSWTEGNHSPCFCFQLTHLEENWHQPSGVGERRHLTLHMTVNKSYASWSQADKLIIHWMHKVFVKNLLGKIQRTSFACGLNSRCSQLQSTSPGARRKETYVQANDLVVSPCSWQELLSCAIGNSSLTLSAEIKQLTLFNGQKASYCP